MKNLLVIGCGNLTSSLLLAQKKANVNQDITYLLLSRTLSKTQALAQSLIPLKNKVINSYPTNEKIDVIILGVKPTQLKQILQDYQELKSFEGEIFSTLGGVTMETLNRAFPKAKVTRLMPSIVAAEQTSTAIYLTQYDKTFLTEWYKPIGNLLKVKNDSQLDDLTLIFGSNAAIMAALLKPWLYVLEQLSQTKSQEIMIEQMMSALNFLKNKSLDSVIDKVKTPGGITAEALRVFQEKNLADTISQALTASSLKAKSWGEQISRDLN